MSQPQSAWTPHTDWHTVHLQLHDNMIFSIVPHSMTTVTFHCLDFYTQSYFLICACRWPGSVTDGMQTAEDDESTPQSAGTNGNQNGSGNGTVLRPASDVSSA